MSSAQATKRLGSSGTDLPHPNNRTRNEQELGRGARAASPIKETHPPHLPFASAPPEMERLSELPGYLVANIACRLDAATLRALGQTCRTLRELVSQFLACEWLVAKHGAEAAERWANISWLQRLHLEACIVGCDRQYVNFDRVMFAGGGRVFVPSVGPFLLVSAVATRDQRLLVWRVRVQGNETVEFGVVPDEPYLLANNDALHQCVTTRAHPDRLPNGFHSDITVGSKLPVDLLIAGQCGGGGAVPRLFQGFDNTSAGCHGAALGRGASSERALRRPSMR